MIRSVWLTALRRERCNLTCGQDEAELEEPGTGRKGGVDGFKSVKLPDPFGNRKSESRKPGISDQFRNFHRSGYPPDVVLDAAS